jgi:hypothetical protein
MPKEYRFPTSSRPFSIISVTLRELDVHDVRYAVAAYDETSIVRGNYCTLLQLHNDLIRCSITHVDGTPVERPYLPRGTFLGWTLRTANLLRLAFEDVNDEDHLGILLRQVLGPEPPTPTGHA